MSWVFIGVQLGWHWRLADNPILARKEAGDNRHVGFPPTRIVGIRYNHATDTMPEITKGNPSMNSTMYEEQARNWSKAAYILSKIL
jgi:hypothetical protein